jgi:hypothetical protein
LLCLFVYLLRARIGERGGAEASVDGHYLDGSIYSFGCRPCPVIKPKEEQQTKRHIYIRTYKPNLSK